MDASKHTTDTRTATTTSTGTTTGTSTSTNTDASTSTTGNTSTHTSDSTSSSRSAQDGGRTLRIVFDAWACDQGFSNIAVGLSLPTTVSVRDDAEGGLTVVGTVVLLGIGLILAGAVVFLVNREGKVRRYVYSLLIGVLLVYLRLFGYFSLFTALNKVVEGCVSLCKKPVRLCVSSTDVVFKHASSNPPRSILFWLSMEVAMEMYVKRY